MFLRGLALLGLVAGMGQAVQAQVPWRCATITDEATKAKLLEMVRPRVEEKLFLIQTNTRTLEQELEVHDVYFKECVGRHWVKFVPHKSIGGHHFTFVFNKTTGRYIESISDGSRYKTWKNEEFFNSWP